MLTTIRHITATELHAFAQFAACQDRGFAPVFPAKFEKWLGALWQIGHSAPERCFLAERDAKPIAAVVYWEHESKRKHIEHLKFPPDEPAVLDLLLTESLRELRSQGIESVWVELLSPPLAEPTLTILAKAFERNGFGAPRERLTFIWKPDPNVTDIPCRLTFRSLAEVGKEAVIAALAEMTADSLDAGFAKGRRTKGALAFAESEFADSTRPEPFGWQIGYDAAGTAVGIISTGIVGRQPAVLEVAVKPSHRGQRYARDLLARAIATLRPAWMSNPAGPLKVSVRGDVDAANLPMVKAFGAVGFQNVCSNRQYERDLAS